MDLSDLATLKRKLVEADDFASVWDYFMTHFGERRDFMALGKRVSSPLLEAAIAQAAQEVFGTRVPLRNLFLLRLQEHRFIHGGLSVQGRIANVFYFEEIGVGLLAVVLSFAGDNRLIRFTTCELPGSKVTRQ